MFYIQKKLEECLMERRKKKINEIPNIENFLNQNLDIARKLSNKLGYGFYPSVDEIKKNGYEILFENLKDEERQLLMRNKVLLVKQDERITLVIPSVYFSIQNTHIPYSDIVICPSASIDEFLNSNKKISDELNTKVFTKDQANDLLLEVLTEAVVRNVNDVYIRPSLDGYVIAFESSEKMVKYKDIDHAVANALIGVVGVKAKIPTTSDYPMLDGKMSVDINYTQKEFRVGFIKSAHSRKADITIRIGGFFNAEKRIEDLGFSQPTIDLIRQNYLKKKLLILSAPTGNGKTTAILTILLELVIKYSKKISTVEDPIEFDLSDYFSQMQINLDGEGKYYVDYQKAIKAMLRAKPHVIFVGEMRDNISAQGAIESARTGHPTFTTLHTGRADLIPSRIKGFGISENEAIENLGMTLCIALKEKLCEACKTKDETTGYYEANKNHNISSCPKCLGRGYFGKILISEAILFNNDVSSMNSKEFFKERRTYQNDLMWHLENGNISKSDYLNFIKEFHV